jgi:hypothetical protein
MIKHEPIFDTDKICELYSEKDGAVYVLERRIKELEGAGV